MRLRFGPVMLCVALTACSDAATRPTAISTSDAVLGAVSTATWTAIGLYPSAPNEGLVVGAINNRGQIAGYEIVQGVLLPHIPFIEKAGQRRFLNRLQGKDFLAPNAINDNGVVVGVAYTGYAYGFVPVFYWDSDTPSVVPGVPVGGATDVSETGWIVGTGYPSGSGPRRAFLWRRGWAQARFLVSTPDTMDTDAHGVNNAGYVVGSAGGRPGFWGPDGKFEAIPLPAGVLGGYASEINDANQVVGTVAVVERAHPLWGGENGFLWTKGRPLVLLPGLFSSRATDIDRRGRVFGVVSTDTDYPAVWIGGAWTMLAQGVPGYLFDATDCGTAVGWDFMFPATIWRTEC